MSDAGTRVHGTTPAQPLVLFKAERALLHWLPPAAPDLAPGTGWCCTVTAHVQFEKSLYSASQAA